MIVDGQQLIHGDCLEELKNLESDSIDSIVTDPPYELGFMNKHWDNTGIAYNIDLWKECLRVLKPGAHLLSFGGTRTYHRMTCAIEDAGFEIRDMIEWVYGSGFPKSLNIGKAIDNLAGAEREVIGYNKQGVKSIFDGGKKRKRTLPVTLPVTLPAMYWEGWGTALKPAHETICLARKPISEKNIALNVLKWGTGGLNIDESRIEYISEYDKKHQADIQKGQGIIFGGSGKSFSSGNLQGRFPANLIHDGSDEVKACFPARGNGYVKKGYKTSGGKNVKFSNMFQNTNDFEHLKDTVSTSDFFKSIIYTSKAGPSERGDNDHPTVKPVELMKYLIKLITPKNGVVLDPFAGSFTTGVACNKLNRKFIGIEKELEYFNIGVERMKANRNLFLEAKC